MKVYISGKITGLDLEEAREKFAVSEAKLRGSGHEPVNPFMVNPCQVKDWREYMIEDIKALVGCDAVLMQSDWRQSEGAKLEFTIAATLGMKVIFEDAIDIDSILYSFSDVEPL